MNYALKFVALLSLLVVAFGFTGSNGEANYKCMIQMTNYTGEGAYVVVSLIKPDGTYEKTLSVHGKEQKWYPDIIHWWGFQKKSQNKLDGITGSSITGGQRAMTVLKIDASKLNKGYKLLFESAVEGQVYYKKDLLIDFSTSGISQKAEGSGYIRYVRILPG